MARRGTYGAPTAETLGTRWNIHGVGQPPIGFEDRIAREEGSHVPQGGSALAIGARVRSPDNFLEGKPRLAALMARRRNCQRTRGDVTSKPAAPNGLHYGQSRSRFVRSPATTYHSEVFNSDLNRPRSPLPNAQGATNPRDPIVGQYPLVSPISKRYSQTDTDYGRSDRNRCFATPSPAAILEPSLYAHRNGEPSVLSSSARLGHGVPAWELGAGSTIHPQSPETSLSSSEPLYIHSFCSSEATSKRHTPPRSDNSGPDRDSGGPGSLEGAVGPRQPKRIWRSSPQHDGDMGHPESGGGVNGTCRMLAHRHTKVTIFSRGGDHDSQGIEVGRLGYEMGSGARQAHSQSDREVERPEAETEILRVGCGNLQTHDQGNLPVGITYTQIQTATSTPEPAAIPNPQTMAQVSTPKLGGYFRSVNHRPGFKNHKQESDDPETAEPPGSNASSHSDSLESPRQLSGILNRAPASNLSSSMALNSLADGGTDRQESISLINKQNLLSVQLSKMTTQGLTQWMAKKERETRNRLRREGRDKGFRNEQTLLKYVNDRIEEPSKSDWPGLNKCPIEHAWNNEKKRANRREVERERLSKYRMTDDTSQ